MNNVHWEKEAMQETIEMSQLINYIFTPSVSCVV